MVVVITGHRPKKLWDTYNIYHALYIQIGKEIRDRLLQSISELKEDETITLVTGMALGIDTVFALVGIKLKERFPGKIKINCIIPCKGHSDRWQKPDRDRHALILKTADLVHYSSEGSYSGFATMYKRDEDMVDLLVNDGDYLMSVWNGFKSGGTYHTISYAEDHKKATFNINPLKYAYLVEGTYENIAIKKEKDLLELI